MESNCREYKLYIQALADGELNKKDEEALSLFLHLSNCKECRDDYFETLDLSKKISVDKDNKPPQELFAKFEKKRSSFILRLIGYLLILVPYILIIIAGIIDMFKDNSNELLQKISFIAIIAGIILLLIYTIIGRIKESKEDKYKEIIR